MTEVDVRVLHRRITGHYVNAPEVAVCEYCTSGGDPYCYPEGADRWPCPTIEALDRRFPGQQVT